MWTEEMLGPRPADIARNAATVRGSHSRDACPPEAATDGDPHTLWVAQPAEGEKPWIEIEWDSPQVVRQILVRLRRRSVTRVTAQVSVNGGWVTVATAGDGSTPLGYNILFRLPETVTGAVRLADFEGHTAVDAVEVHQEATPLVVRVGADLLGGLTGIVAESLGVRAVAGAEVTITGAGKAGSWTAETTTDERGMFFATMPVGLRGPVRVIARTPEESAECLVDAADLPGALTPMPQDVPAVPLDGEWEFAVAPDEGFERPAFDDPLWSPIAVPAHWEFEGFRSPSGVGGYRTWVDVPGEWRGRRVKIGFDGVYNGAEVWVNGSRVGRHEGGATPFVLDVTEAVRVGRANLIAVRVEEYTAAQTLDKMSMYADFHLAGIYRSCRLFSVPATHICRFHAEAILDDDYTDGVITAYLGVVNESDRAGRRARVRLELRDPEGAPVKLPAGKAEFALDAWQRSDQTVTLPVKTPLHWEAEHPRLYTLTAILVEGSRETERVTRRIGFRKVEIRGQEFFVNGVKAKLAGACHHDSHPLLGRAVTPELTRRDLELMKAANLNAVRTSHYPPIPEFLDLTDEIGLFVEDEGPFCWAHNSMNVLLTPLVLQHEAELLERDRSHPSVLWWSVCNESRWGIAFDNAYHWMRRQDLTRPYSAATSSDIDIATLHNPTSLERMRASEDSPVPMIYDEGMCLWQGIWGDAQELWNDPGLRDYWVVPLIGVWEYFLTSRTNFGHMIWCWGDDIFSIPGYGMEFGRAGLPVQYLNEIYKLPGRGITGDAPWGIVDGWRRPKPEWWLCKKIHTPVRISEHEPLALPAPGEPIRVPLRNSYFYTDLSELRIDWAVGSETGSAVAAVPPQSEGVLEIRPTRAVVAGDLLDLSFRDARGELVDTCLLTVGTPHATVGTPPTPGLRDDADELVEPFTVVEDDMLSGPTLRFVTPEFEIAFDTSVGAPKRVVAGSGPVFCDVPLLHVQSLSSDYQALPNRFTWKKRGFTWQQEGDSIRVRIDGSYEHFEGSYEYLLSPDGGMDIEYCFTNTGPELRAKEIGLKLSLPIECQHLSWRRKAEFTVYPDDHIGRSLGDSWAFADHGAALPPTWAWSQDNTPLGCNDFRSTKRTILWAGLEDTLGYGVMVLSDGTQHVRASMQPDRAVLHVNDWYGGTAAIAWGEWTGNYGFGKTVATGDVLSGTVHLHLLHPGS